MADFVEIRHPDIKGWDWDETPVLQPASSVAHWESLGWERVDWSKQSKQQLQKVAAARGLNPAVNATASDIAALLGAEANVVTPAPTVEG